MKAQAKYTQLLERELEFLREQLSLARRDLELYRGKIERLELALATHPQYMHLVPPPVPTAPTSIRKRFPPQPAVRMPFSELRDRWNNLTAEQQEEAMNKGWNVDEQPKEDPDAGKQQL